MPMIPEKESLGIRPIGLPEGFEVTPDPDAPVERPGVLETFGAGFRQENVAVNAVDGLLESSIGEPDPEHNPWPLIEGTEFEPHADSFLSSVNEADTRRRMERVRSEMADRKMLAHSGGWGVAAAVAGSMLDLPTLIPGAGVIRGIQAGRAALKTGAAVAALAGGTQAGAEVVLHGTQETRTGTESAFNIGGSILLGGLLDGAQPVEPATPFAAIRSLVDSGQDDDAAGIAVTTAAARAVEMRETARRGDVPRDTVLFPSTGNCMAPLYGEGAFLAVRKSGVVEPGMMAAFMLAGSPFVMAKLYIGISDNRVFLDWIGAAIAGEHAVFWMSNPAELIAVPVADLVALAPVAGIVSPSWAYEPFERWPFPAEVLPDRQLLARCVEPLPTVAFGRLPLLRE